MLEGASPRTRPMSDGRVRPCPKWESPPCLLEAVSHEATVSFYRCDVRRVKKPTIVEPPEK
jgi:hypothetical protein